MKTKLTALLLCAVLLLTACTSPPAATTTPTTTAPPETTAPVETTTAPPETTEPPVPETTAPLGSLDNPYMPGMYKVGADLPAGEYVFVPSSGSRAYVCVSADSNQDDILENSNFYGSFFVTVADGQYLEASRCLFVVAADVELLDIDDGVLDEGMFRVGIDIPAGEYKVTADDRGYWCIYNDSVAPFDIVSNDNFEGSAYVTVKDGQYLELSRCNAVPVE